MSEAFSSNKGTLMMWEMERPCSRRQTEQRVYRVHRRTCVQLLGTEYGTQS